MYLLTWLYIIFCRKSIYNTLLLIIYSVALDYFSTIAVKGCLTALNATNADSGYYQTTYQRQITINDSNFVTTRGVFGRASMKQFGNFDAIVIKYIYGIKWLL